MGKFSWISMDFHGFSFVAFSSIKLVDSFRRFFLRSFIFCSFFSLLVLEVWSNWIICMRLRRYIWSNAYSTCRRQKREDLWRTGLKRANISHFQLSCVIFEMALCMEFNYFLRFEYAMHTLTLTVCPSVTNKELYGLLWNDRYVE